MINATIKIMIFRFVKPAAVQHWISVNAAGSLKTSPTDSWMAYLAANSGTTGSIADRETQFLRAAPQSATGSSLFDLWQNYLASVAGGSQVGTARQKFQSRYN